MSLEEVAATLESLAEELSDLALDRLKAAVEDRSTEAAAEERRITRARRSVERALAALREATTPTEES